MMDRRKFLLGVAAAAISPAVPMVSMDDGVALTSWAHPINDAVLYGTSLVLRGFDMYGEPTVETVTLSAAQLQRGGPLKLGKRFKRITSMEG